jgi:hypothetical protein
MLLLFTIILIVYADIRKSEETYRRVVFVPISPSILSASSSICMPSVCARSLRICSISTREYGNVRIIRSLSRRSKGMPCGEIMSSVPLQDNNKLQFDRRRSKFCSRHTYMHLNKSDFLFKQYQPNDQSEMSLNVLQG